MHSRRKADAGPLTRVAPPSPMDEIEARVAEIELVVVEMAAWLGREVVDDTMRSIADGVAGAGDEERMIRLQALQLLADGLRRFSSPECVLLSIGSQPRA